MIHSKAAAMDGRLGGGFTLLPDQMGTLNAVLILAYIPIFQVCDTVLFELSGMAV